MSTHPPSEQPTREGLLSLLDSEIEGLQSVHSRNGWSLWAILASIVGVLWILTEQLSAASFNSTNVAIIFIAGVTFARVSFLMYMKLSVIPEAQEETRFYWGHNAFSGMFLGMLVEFIRSILLILLAYNLTLPSLFLIPFTIGHILIALIALGGLLIPYLAPRFAVLPAPPKTTPGKIGFHGIWVLIAVPLTVSLFFIARACPVPTGEAISDYRIGGLLVVVAILLDMLLSVIAPSSKLQSLTDIRRKLVFNRINLDEAILQTEIALGGMRAVDALRDSYTSIMLLLDRMDEQVANAELAQKSIEDVIANLKGNELTEEQFNALSSMQRGFIYCLEERGRYYEQIREQINDFDDRVKWILRGLPTEHQTINQIFQLRKTRIESSDKRYFDLLNKQEIIQGQLVKLRPLDKEPKTISE